MVFLGIFKGGGLASLADTGSTGSALGPEPDFGPDFGLGEDILRLLFLVGAEVVPVVAVVREAKVTFGQTIRRGRRTTHGLGTAIDISSPS